MQRKETAGKEAECVSLLSGRPGKVTSEKRPEDRAGAAPHYLGEEISRQKP